MSKLILTIQERQQKLEQIASYALEVLYVTPVKELRELAKGIIPNYTTFRKPELLQAIVEVSDNLRKTKELQQEQERIKAQEELLRQQEEALKLSVARLATPEELERKEVSRDSINPQTSNQRAQVIFDNILKLVQTSMDLGTLKDAIYPLTVQQITLETTCYAPSTIKSNKTAIKEALDNLLEPHKDARYYYDLKASIEFFKSTYEKGLSHITVAINAEYKTQVAARVANQTPIDPQGLLERAQAVLEKPQDFKENEVAIALALTTGRRMAEIMATGNFEVETKNTLRFSGLTKARASKDIKSTQEIVIPSLVDSELVLRGIRYLEDNNKRLDDPTPVNDRYAKRFSRVLKKNWALVANIPEEYRYVVKEGKPPEDVFTFKSLRALYAEVAYTRYGQSIDKDLYFSRILGHDPNDLNTANSYKVWAI